jgi:3-oxoacyl-[acyl-carrier-protein] synthase-1
MKPIHIESFTAASCIGLGAESTCEALLAQASGLKQCDFETVHIETHIGEVPGVDEVRLPRDLARFDCRNNRLAELALRQDGFLDKVAAATARRGTRRIGVFVGTSTAGILQTELAYRQRDSASGALPVGFEYSSTHNSFSVADYLRQRLHLAGPAVVVSCACASSAKVFGSARRMLEAGLIDAALVGGVDSLCLTTLYGFHSLQLSSPSPCRPFDISRNGISIGEAAAFALLERAPDNAALRRGRIERCLSYVGAAPGGPGGAPRHAGGSARRALGARGHRLHQFARHRDSEQ